jgi:IS605 OrfB family transposase
MKQGNTRTFETRISQDTATEEILQSAADLFAHIQHRLLADISSGKTSRELKNDYLVCYEITARQFNAIRVQVEGKIASIKQRQPALIAEAKERRASLSKKIKRLIKKKADPNLIHQKQRRLRTLERKLEKLQEDRKNGTVRICFGSKKLFRAQFDLKANGFASHEEWRQEWKKARANELFFLGSKDETAGNQTCRATVNSDQTLDLRVRLPNALAKYGKYLTLTKVAFKYGKDKLLAALNNPEGQAITWRFVHDKKGWRLFASFEVEPAACITHPNNGVIGLDINVDHFALVETDRFGNPIHSKVISYNLYGKSSNQARAIIGDAAASAIAYAESTCKPLIFEDLDFQKKKGALREKNHKSYSRMLSSLSYQSMITHLKSRAVKKGILASQVNPAFTSVIGRVKFAKKYGLSIHQAAALTIGRRFLCCSEKVPSSLSEIPDGKDGHVTLPLPARNRDRHVWSLWRQVSKKLQTALAAYFRTAPNTKSRSRSRTKPASETRPFSEVAGETPARESSEALLV